MASLPKYFGVDYKEQAEYVGSFEIAIKGKEEPVLARKMNHSYIKH